MSFFNADIKSSELYIRNTNNSILNDNSNLSIQSSDNNITINPANNLFLKNHTIISNTFTVSRNNQGTIATGNQTLNLDFSLNSNFQFTLSDASNVTINNPTNVSRIGQIGSLIFITPSSGSTHNLNWYNAGDSKWYFINGIAPNFSNDNNVIDVFNYLVVDTDKIIINDTLGFKKIN